MTIGRVIAMAISALLSLEIFPIKSAERLAARLRFFQKFLAPTAQQSSQLLGGFIERIPLMLINRFKIIRQMKQKTQDFQLAVYLNRDVELIGNRPAARA